MAEFTPWRLLAFAVAVGVVYAATKVTLAIHVADLRNAVGVVVGAGATLLGFLVSAGALLYAVSNTRLVRNIQRTGHFRSLLKDLFVAATAFLAAVVWGTICLFFAESPTQDGVQSGLSITNAVYGLLFVTTLSYLLLLPVGWKMWLLLSHLTPDDTATLE